MPGAGTNVMRGSKSTKHGNTITYKTIILYFQRYPGTDDASGIANEDYVFKIAGKQIAKGKLGPKGNVLLRLPSGTVGTLEVFGTLYQVQVRSSLEEVTTTQGVQSRLNMLGYALGDVDGVVGAKTDRATLDFQADNNPLTITGLFATATTDQLKKMTG
jgi:hypothetical protein